MTRYNLYVNRDADGKVHGVYLDEDPEGDWTAAENATDLAAAVDALVKERDWYHDKLYELNAEVYRLLGIVKRRGNLLSRWMHHSAHLSPVLRKQTDAELGGSQEATDE